MKDDASTTHNPYTGEYHAYLEELKAKIDQTSAYAPHQEIPSSTNIFSNTQSEQPSKTKQVIKTSLWIGGAFIIGISVVAFITQATLLVFSNAQKISKSTTSSTTDTVLQDVYVRADVEQPLFDTPEKTAQDNISSSMDLGIPGVSALGFDSKKGESLLTDNINKYSPTTLVVGGRQGEVGARTSVIGGGDEESYASSYSVLPKAVEPVLNSKAYIVADRDTGEIIIQKNGDTAYPLASVTKLMTALVVRERMDLQSVAIVSRDASNTYGAQGSLGVGEKIRLTDLLFPLLMESSNDAAEVFADQYGHNAFMEEMNKKAKALSMNDTYYGDPSGLDPKNISTPYDLLKLARYIYKNDPQIYDMTRVKQFSIKNHTWYNRNALLPLAGFTGGKNGYIDQSLQTTVSMFDVSLAKGGDRNVVIIILKSQNKYTDTVKLLNYLKKSVVYEPQL